ncbi:MAG: hypothetical protein JWM81_717 [Candidatus Saccharibacteria bacterium]|nr:hypothetical protein [Candidatus Saccharibacteria bacterium]
MAETLTLRVTQDTEPIAFLPTGQRGVAVKLANTVLSQTPVETLLGESRDQLERDIYSAQGEDYASSLTIAVTATALRAAAREALWA